MALGADPVISTLKTGDETASQEYISVYNNSSDEVDITNWCLYYVSANTVINPGSTGTKITCFSPPDDDTRLILDGFSYLNLATNELITKIQDFTPDFIFSAKMSATGGHVRLFNASNTEVDRVGWGNASSPEVLATVAHSSSKALFRKNIQDTNYLQDINNNHEDFIEAELTIIPSSGLREEAIIRDYCGNIDGIQDEVPVGYFYDLAGNCVWDICPNISGLQVEVPLGYELNEDQNCQEFKLILPSSKLVITELLPNAKGDDTGKEFIEIYNPNNYEVDLLDYKLILDTSKPKSYEFASQILNPFSFAYFNDTLTKLTLPNSSASLTLVAPNGDVVSQTDIYINPKDDSSWALVDDIWQYTDNPTPGAENVLTVVTSKGGDIIEDELQPCPEGKYRNPETNRCRNIATLVAELSPCAEGQERNPATNRCRSVISSVSSLVPCKAGQERNPETNRCRSISGSSNELVPCAEGQERNPETNRCRKVTSPVAQLASAQVNDIPSKISSGTSWLVYGLIVSGVLAYGVYEWRSGIANVARKLKFWPLKK